MRPFSVRPIFRALWFAVSIAATPYSVIAATNHIAMGREVLLEAGVAVTPHAMIRTPDGGYVIVGALHESQAWATRIDANMHVVWRHEVAHPSSMPAEGVSVYEAAVALRDNTTLLCGHQDTGALKTPNIVGLLTRIDARGAVLDQRQLTPMSDDSFKLAYLHDCATDKQGIIAVGDAARILGTGPIKSLQNFLWVVDLDGIGAMNWQRAEPSIDQSIGEQLLVMPNTDLAVEVSAGEVLLDSKGVTKAHRNGNFDVFVRPVTPESTLQIVSQGGSMPLGLVTLNSDFKEVERKSAKSRNTFAVRRAYLLPGGDIALFGSEDEGGASTAAVSWLRRDLGSTETHIFTPTFASTWIDAVVPSGEPREFATVRQVLPARHMLSPSELRIGVLLTFVTFK